MDDKIPFQWNRLITRIGGIVALIPLVAAFYFSARVPAEQTMIGERKPASLVFSQYAVNLGELPSVGSYPAYFEFYNQGMTPITITKIEPSCGCLGPRLARDKKLYKPGEQGRFFVSVKTASEASGPQTYQVMVHYNDGEPKSQLLTFRCVIPEQKVTVSPSELFFYQLNGEEASHEIELKDHRGKMLTVTDVSLSETIQDVTAAKIIKQEQKQGTTTASILVEVAGVVPAGRKLGSLKIRTDDPDYDAIEVPILVHGPAIQLSSGIEAPASETFIKQAAYQEEP